jgi:glycosyltransferase involved in cell wall biosynthesis
LQAVAEQGVELKILSPQPILDYSRAKRRWIGSRLLPRQRWDGKVEVFHPYWGYPPFGGALNGILLFISLVIPVLRLKKHFDFKLIDAHFAHPDGVAAALAAWISGRPFIVTLRGNETMHSRKLVRGALIGWVLRRASRVVTVSERLKLFAINAGARLERVTTISNGIDASVFYPRDREASRRRFQIDPGETLVVSAGALIERKGHHRIVRALKPLVASGRNIRLLIAGTPGREGNFEAEIEQTVNECDMSTRVHLLGHVNQQDLPMLMSAADIFCLASSREGWPNVVHEAMGCGTPVVATDIGGIPEMVPSGEYGCVVPPGDQGALELALEEATNRNWDRDAIAKWAHSRSWEKVAMEVIAEMRLACAGAKEYR